MGESFIQAIKLRQDFQKHSLLDLLLHVRPAGLKQKSASVGKIGVAQEVMGSIPASHIGFFCLQMTSEVRYVFIFEIYGSNYIFYLTLNIAII